jgi:hypothetical protein
VTASKRLTIIAESVPTLSEWLLADVADAIRAKYAIGLRRHGAKLLSNRAIFAGVSYFTVVVDVIVVAVALPDAAFKDETRSESSTSSLVD